MNNPHVLKPSDIALTAAQDVKRTGQPMTAIESVRGMSAIPGFIQFANEIRTVVDGEAFTVWVRRPQRTPEETICALMLCHMNLKGRGQ